MNIACFKDYILIHNGDFYCDASDTVFDAIVTVDCAVEQGKIDIGAGDDYPNMDRFFNLFVERVRVVEVKNDIPIIDINGWLGHNHAKVLEWVRDNWSVDSDWDWDDIKYQMIQEINNGIAGNKSNKTYGRYAGLFESMPMAPEQTTTYTIPKDILGLWEQTVCEIRSEIKAQDNPALVYAKALCDKLEHSMCALAGGPYELKYKITED